MSKSTVFGFWRRLRFQQPRARLEQGTSLYFCQNPNQEQFNSHIARRSITSPTKLSDSETVDDQELFVSSTELSEQELTDIQELTRNWRDTPALNPNLHFPCWKVPVKTLQTILQSPLTQSYLATRMDIWEHVSRGRRVKVIRNAETGDTDKEDYKLVLLRPDMLPPEKLPQDVQTLLQDCQVVTDDGTINTQQLRPSDFTASYVLENVLPKKMHPPPTSFETIGHVAHLNLRALHVPYRYLVGEIFLETLPSIKTVIHKVGQVSGPYRTYPYEIVANRTRSDKDKDFDQANPTVVSFSESGVNLQFDVQEVYWSSRLSEERRRLIQQEFRKGQWIADAFSGVGALCLQAAVKKQCRITANDWNPAAIEALKQNAERNKLQDAFYDIRCGDAYDFLTSLGFSQPDSNDLSMQPNRSQRPLPHLPHHVVLNFPLHAASFLGALRWWPVGGTGRRSKKSKAQQEVEPRVHVYTFAKEISCGDDESKDDHESTVGPSAEHMAVDEIASHLLPRLPGQADSNMTRWEELDQNFGCNIKVHNVRDVAPGKVVLCVSFSATQRLLKFMQGDF